MFLFQDGSSNDGAGLDSGTIFLLIMSVMEVVAVPPIAA